MKTLAVLFLALLVPLGALASKRKLPPPAPLPSQVTQAKTVFLTNGGGSELAFDAFYQAFKQWGKYEIVGSPDKADLVITLQYWVEKNGSRTVPVTNTYTGQTTYYSHENVDPQLKMTVLDAKTKEELWSTIDHRRLARRESNREKETVNSAARLVDELKARSQ
ncbi:MAG TPA: hypothetical protein VHZ09_13395 [Acidobacteriaceae bacterium]|jgi:hypothetical protein|nr:hypothetical protein [Acidobacteriaceae bacterium]